MSFDKRLKQIFKELVGIPHETLFVLDSETGDIVFFRKGEESRVIFSPDIYKYLEDRVIVHSHPGGFGNGFSKADVYIAFEANVHQSILVAQDIHYSVGSSWVYTMTRPESGWPIPGSSALQRFDSIWEQVVNEFSSNIENRRLDKYRAKVFHNHECMKRFAKSVGFDYSRRGAVL